MHCHENRLSYVFLIVRLHVRNTFMVYIQLELLCNKKKKTILQSLFTLYRYPYFESGDLPSSEIPRLLWLLCKHSEINNGASWIRASYCGDHIMLNNCSAFLRWVWRACITIPIFSGFSVLSWWYSSITFMAFWQSYNHTFNECVKQAEKNPHSAVFL